MKHFLINFFSLFAGEFSEAPQAWGALHIVFFAVGLALSIALALVFRKSDTKRFNRILRTAGFILAGMEIFKISFFHFALNDCDLRNTANIFPFQLCSLPIYLAPIASYLKEDSKVRKAMLTFMMTYTFMSGLSAFINPSGILMVHILPTFHSLIWHMLLVFIGMLIAFSGRGGNTLRDFGRAVLLFLICCHIALFLNILLPMLLPGSVVNMFYIGPERSSLIVFDKIYDKYDWVVQYKSYEMALTVGAFIFFLPHLIVGKAKKKKL
ncbi:MAG: YwaF family protein [Clostridia bacterium]|nr:YwaF family protein [Clostridia bacterium]